MTGRFEIVGEHYRWHEDTHEFEDIRDGRRYADSLYGCKVAVYEDRVRTWFLNTALRATAAGPWPEDYVAVSIALAYLEGVEQYRRGETTPQNQSGEWFRASARRAFPDASNEAINRLWTAVRNGLFHSGFTKGPTLLSYDRREPLVISDRYLHINPALFVRAVIDDFDQYIRQLRRSGSDEIGKNFEKLWDSIWNET